LVATPDAHTHCPHTHTHTHFTHTLLLLQHTALCAAPRHCLCLRSTAAAPALPLRVHAAALQHCRTPRTRLHACRAPHTALSRLPTACLPRRGFVPAARAAAVTPHTLPATTPAAAAALLHLFLHARTPPHTPLHAARSAASQHTVRPLLPPRRAFTLLPVTYLRLYRRCRTCRSLPHLLAHTRRADRRLSLPRARAAHMPAPVPTTHARAHAPHTHTHTPRTRTLHTARHHTGSTAHTLPLPWVTHTPHAHTHRARRYLPPPRAAHHARARTFTAPAATWFDLWTRCSALLQVLELVRHCCEHTRQRAAHRACLSRRTYAFALRSAVTPPPRHLDNTRARLRVRLRYARSRILVHAFAHLPPPATCCRMRYRPCYHYSASARDRSHTRGYCLPGRQHARVVRTARRGLYWLLASPAAFAFCGLHLFRLPAAHLQQRFCFLARTAFLVRDALRIPATYTAGLQLIRLRERQLCLRAPRCTAHRRGLRHAARGSLHVYCGCLPPHRAALHARLHHTAGSYFTRIYRLHGLGRVAAAFRTFCRAHGSLLHCYAAPTGSRVLPHTAVLYARLRTF